MKNIIIAFCSCLLFIILSGCDERNEPQEPIHPITLLSPIDNETVDYCCFTFEWKTQVTLTDARLRLAEDRQFSSILLDTIVDVLHHGFMQKLYPGRKYYWKVDSEFLQAEAIDSFQVKDYVKYFEGNYTVDVRVQDWDFVDGVTWDTMYPGNMDIIWISPEKVEVFEHVTQKGRTYKYFPWYDASENTIVYIYEDASRTSFCYLNYVANSFAAGVTEGGVGARRYYGFSGNK